MSSYYEEGDSESLVGRETKKTGSSVPTMNPAYLVLALLLALGIIGTIGAAMLWSKWSQIDNLPYECSAKEANSFNLKKRFPDTVRSDWGSWSRDINSVRYNPHVKVSSNSLKSARGSCANRIATVNNSGTVGVSTTITQNYELNMVFFCNWGNYSNMMATCYGLNMSDNCAVVWSRTVQSWGVETDISGNDADGVDNPYALVRTSMVVVQNRTGGINLVFGDLGTSELYNSSTCTSLDNASTPVCGARVYSAEASTGKLLWRTLVIEPQPYNDYNRQSDLITSSPKVVGNSAFFGMSSSQSGDLSTTGIIDFYGRYFEIDINDGAILNIARTTSDAQLDAGNFGTSIWGSDPPVDLVSQRVIFGTSNNYNYSQAVLDCLLAGHDRLYCLEEGIINDSVFAVSTVDFGRQWINSPYGVDAWNTACIGVGDPSYCPDDHGPDYDFGIGCIVIENECGQRYAVCLQKSGIIYSYEIDTGKLKWKTYAGPGGYLVPSWGLSFDGQDVFFSIVNHNYRSYLTMDGTLRCDGMWVSVNAWTGKVNWVEPVPCSRSSDDCALLNGLTVEPDPYLVGYFPNSTLSFADRSSTIKYASQATCYGDASADFRNDPTAGSAAANGGTIVTDKYMFAGAYTGYMYAFEKKNGHIAKTFERCDTGIIYGSASIALLSNGEQILAWGCGYGRVTFGFPAEAGSNEVKFVTLPSD